MCKFCDLRMYQDRTNLFKWSRILEVPLRILGGILTNVLFSRGFPQVLQGNASIIPLIRNRWCQHLIVVVEFECSRDPESYAGGSVATGSVTHAGQVKG
jgi:hypothetical protein